MESDEEYRATQQPRSDGVASHVSAPCRTFRFVGSRSFSAMGYAIYVVLVPLLSGRVPKKKDRFILILNVIIVVLVCILVIGARLCNLIYFKIMPALDDLRHQFLIDLSINRASSVDDGSGDVAPSSGPTIKT